MLKASLESAMERLAAALQWLSKDLPLLPQSSVSMITLDCPGPLPGGLAAPGEAAGPAGSGEARSKGDRSGAQQAQQQAQPQLVLATNPCFGDRVTLPDAVSADIAAAAAVAGAAGVGKAGTAHALRIWLHTPLGPAQADMVPGELLQDEAVAAGCPFTLRALPRVGPAAGKGTSTGAPPRARGGVHELLFDVSAPLHAPVLNNYKQTHSIRSCIHTSAALTAPSACPLLFA